MAGGVVGGSRRPRGGGRLCHPAEPLNVFLVNVEADTDPVNRLLSNMAAEPDQEGLAMNANPCGRFGVATFAASVVLGSFSPSLTSLLALSESVLGPGDLPPTLLNPCEHRD